jgi:hypothetical protein
MTPHENLVELATSAWHLPSDRPQLAIAGLRAFSMTATDETMVCASMLPRHGGTDRVRLGGDDYEPNLGKGSLSDPAVARLANDEQPGRRALPGMLRLRQGAGQGEHPRRLTPTAADIGQTGVLRVAWTLSDLAGRSVPGGDEIAEALGMRLQRAAA